jgi:hypothetical protein
MKPFTNKHSIAAGSPVHTGGSYKNSPLDQRDSSQKKVATLTPYPQPDVEAYYSSPGYRGDSGGYYIVGNKPDDYEEPFTPEQLATRIDVVSGDPLDYNTTSGIVEMQGGSGAYELKPRKTINLEGVDSSLRTLNSINQRAQRNTEVPITNLEFDTNRWSSTNRENFPRQTRYSPQYTYSSNAKNFNINRKRDSLGTMNNRNVVALNQRLGANNQYLRRERLSEDQMKLYGYLPKQ